MRTTRTAWLATLLLLAPVASAGPTMSAELTFERAPHLAGPVTLRAERGGFDLRWLAQEALPIEIRASSISGFQIVEERVAAGPELNVKLPSQNRSFRSMSDATLRIGSCVDPCSLLLYTEGEGSLAIEGTLGGALRSTSALRSYHALTKDDAGAPETFYHPVPAGTIQAAAQGTSDTTAVEHMSASARGIVRFFATNVTGWISGPDGEAAFDTIHREEGGAGLSLGSKRTLSYVSFTLEGVDWRPDASHILFFAPAPRIFLSGTIFSASATGRVAIDGTGYPLRAEPFEARGRFEVHPRVDHDAIASVRQTPILPTSTHTASLAGDATYVSIGREPVMDATRDALLQGAVIAAVLVSLCFALHAAVMPLYSRIDRGRVLANGRRRAIHDAIRERPGSTAAALARDLRLSRAVVLHHLAMLEAHQVIRARRVGWARRYYLPDLAPTAATLLLRSALEDDTRRRVASCLARAPATQSALIRDTGLSQRVVAYHLERLEAAGLVTRTAGRPRTYAATSNLTHALDPSMSAPIPRP